VRDAGFDLNDIELIDQLLAKPGSAQVTGMHGQCKYRDDKQRVAGVLSQQTCLMRLQISPKIRYRHQANTNGHQPIDIRDNVRVHHESDPAVLGNQLGLLAPVDKKAQAD
jgi:hypothetical protein